MNRKENGTTPKTEINIGGIILKNPVMPASGTFGYGREYSDLMDLNKLGAIVVKGISLHATEGNPMPRLKETPSGLINSIGLQNPGVDYFAKEHMPFLRQFHTPVIVNIWGRTLEEYVKVSETLDGIEGISGLELNISCPNIKKGGMTFGTDPDAAREVISSVRKATRLPLIPKLSPNVPDISLFARIAEDCGANAVSLINSLPAMAVDIETRKPALGNITGGLTGPAIRPVAVRMVWQAASAIGIPVIGMGGIASAADALEFLIAGASAVAIGTATFAEPSTIISVIEGIERYLSDHGIGDIKELIGSLLP
jgi:dihydroorotate dehydrogenase (NAD+) catalytic subunit